MDLDLNPEKIRILYKSGKLDKNYALELLISFIENSNDDSIRIKSIEILCELEINNSKKYEILENLMISDSNSTIRGTAAKFIIQNYLDKGKDPINWAIRNDSSLEFLSLIMEDMRKADENALRLILLKKFKDLIQYKTKDAKKSYIKYYVEEFKRIFENNPITGFTCKNLCEMFLNFKVISRLIQKFAISYNHFKYYVKDGLVKRLKISGHNIRSMYEINGLEKLTSLEILDLTTNQINEISGIDKLINLKSLLLGDSHHNDGNEITEIKGLDYLVNLEYLDLSFNSITEIKNLENLTNLKFLSLKKNNISTICGLERLKNLEQLYLGGNQIKEIKNLEILEKLEKLFLGGNNIEEIMGLETLTNLRELDLEFNKISEIKCLDNLTKLIILNLNRNQIKEIKDLENLTNLCLLYLDKNQIQEINGLDYLSNLDFLSIEFNPIKEIRDLN